MLAKNMQCKVKKTQKSYRSKCTCMLTKADNKTDDHVHKQCAVIGKTHKDKLLRQMHTYIVCSQKPIANAHLHNTVRKTHKDKLLRQMRTYIVYSQKPKVNAHIHPVHKQCTVKKKNTDKLLRQTKANYIAHIN